MAVLNKGVWTQDDTLPTTDIIPTETTPAAGRYHLYFSFACPYAHRPNLVIHYLGLDEAISTSSVDPYMTDGWAFSDQYPDPLYGNAFLRDLYTQHKADFSGRVVVPTFWDKQEKLIASNTSMDLALDLAENWLSLAKNPVELVPTAQRNEILEMNQWLNSNITSKVYSVGFAIDQAKYAQHSAELFASFASLNERLANQRYLFGEQITLSDFILFPTLIRLEAVYAQLFKCNQQALSSFSHLYRYMLDLYAIPSIRATVDVDYTKTQYFYSFVKVNPSRIVPAGPQLEWLNAE